MKNVIVIESAGTVIGVFTNFKRFWDGIENRGAKQSYSTVCECLALSRPYDLDTCVIESREYRQVIVRKVQTNILRG